LQLWQKLEGESLSPTKALKALNERINGNGRKASRDGQAHVTLLVVDEVDIIAKNKQVFSSR